VSYFVLATVRQAPPAPPSTPTDMRNLWLESWDGSVRIQIGGASHDGPVQLQVDATGLEVAPTEVERKSIPGVPGAVAVNSQTLVRDPLLPLLINTANQTEQWAEKQRLADLTDPSPEKLTPDGSFRLVCASPSGTRQVGLVYESGLEGSGTELPWAVRYVLDCWGPQPYAEDRADTTREYALGGGDVFFALTQADAVPVFADLTLSPDVILGDDMPLDIVSEVAPYVTLEVVGPTGAGVVVAADTGLRLDIPAGVPGGSTLRVVTDPRRKSIRLFDNSDPDDVGEPAAGMLARGSILRPLKFGQNKLSVTAPGATEDTRLRLSYRGQYRSLW
jgi:hypothetical protein